MSSQRPVIGRLDIVFDHFSLERLRHLVVRVWLSYSVESSACAGGRISAGGEEPS